MKRFVRIAGFAILAILILIQFIPIDRTNPAVTREVAWDSPETRALAQRACFDCHSNETVWPWYSYVAPISLRIASHVEEGREHLNFSAWDQPNEGLDEIVEVIERGEMPLSDYLLLHSTAKLSDTEKQALIDGLQATLTNDPPVARSGPARP
ncbi:MAG: heme-binding domain-containing protein [Caldilineaceae bacterium]|nr:heme-binding domain-containing protein [Caldilineaceae bacterium]